MTAPYTVLLHAISGGISLFIFLWIEVVFRRRSHQTSASHYFAYWFLFYFLYYIFLTLPLALSVPVGQLNWFYTIGLISLFFGSFYIIRVPFDVLFVHKRGFIILASAVLSGFIVGIVTLQVLFPINPFLVSSEKLLIWNPHPIAAVLTTWGLIGVALVFVATFFVGAVRTKDKFVRIRSILFGIGAILLALAAEYYYQAKEGSEVLAGMIFGIGGITALALGLLIVEMLKRRQPHLFMKTHGS